MSPIHSSGYTGSFFSTAVQSTRRKSPVLPKEGMETILMNSISSKFGLSIHIQLHSLEDQCEHSHLPNILWSSLFHLQLAELFPDYSLRQHWNCVLCTTEGLQDSSRPQKSILETVLSSLRIPPASPWSKHTSSRKSQPGASQNHLYQPQYITACTMNRTLITSRDVLTDFFMLRNSPAELDNNK